MLQYSTDLPFKTAHSLPRQLRTHGCHHFRNCPWLRADAQTCTSPPSQDQPKAYCSKHGFQDSTEISEGPPNARAPYGWESGPAIEPQLSYASAQPFSGSFKELLSRAHKSLSQILCPRNWALDRQSSPNVTK